MKKLLIVFVTLFLFSVNTFAHKGKTDAYGGHNCKASGTYHFHSGPLVGIEYPSKQEALAALSNSSNTNESTEQTVKSTSKSSSKSNSLYYVASSKSNKYHRPSCRSARRISPSNLIKFNSSEEANSKGYIPCKVCKP